MSLIASIALAVSGATLPACSWDRPGVNPFMGDVVAAVDRYTDIPADVRAKLKARMQKRDYDEIVSIKRDEIAGQARYGSEIRDMHFGSGTVCRTVSRSAWTPTMQERGLVYCEDGQCILVPTVCRNVSRITRIAAKPTAASAAAMPPAEPAQQLASADPQTELEMEPTSAGLPGGPIESAAPGSFAQQAGLVPGGLILASGDPGNSFIGGTNTGPNIQPMSPPTLPPGLAIDGRGPTDPTGPVVPPVVPPVTPPITPPVTPPIIPPITTPVPEPGTWAMLLAGLGAIGFIARRRAARSN